MSNEQIRVTEHRVGALHFAYLRAVSYGVSVLCAQRSKTSQLTTVPNYALRMREWFQAHAIARQRGDAGWRLNRIKTASTALGAAQPSIDA